MKILRSVTEFKDFLETSDVQKGILADTSFLYALAYDDDRIHLAADEVFEVLAEEQISIYSNVISRMEFADLMLRKQLAAGAVTFFSTVERTHSNKPLYNFLKDIRDKTTQAKNEGASFKLDEYRLKKFRKLVNETSGPQGWNLFCENHIGKVLSGEWAALENDLGLNFVEVMEGQTSDVIVTPLLWNDMVSLMGARGVRGPDAMIMNMFSNSSLELLITGDSDYETLISDSGYAEDKAVLIL